LTIYRDFKQGLVSDFTGAGDFNLHLFDQSVFVWGGGSGVASPKFCGGQNV